MQNYYIYETKNLAHWDGWQEVSHALFTSSRGEYPGSFKPGVIDAYLRVITTFAMAISQKYELEPGELMPQYVHWLPVPDLHNDSIVVAFSAIYKGRMYFASRYPMPWLEDLRYKPELPKPRKQRKTKELVKQTG